MNIKQFLIYTILGIGIYCSLTSCNQNKQDNPVPVINRTVKIDANIYYHKSPCELNGYLNYTGFNKLVIFSRDMSQFTYTNQVMSNKTYESSIATNTTITLNYSNNNSLNPIDSVVTSIYIDNNLVIKSNQFTINYTVK